MPPKPSSLLDLLSDRKTWEAFYKYKDSLISAGKDLKELSALIREKKYEAAAAVFTPGADFPLPKKAVISKLSSEKKRTVFIYPEPENTVLKLLTWLLLRKYNSLFPENLYSFRPGRTAKDAVRKLLRTRGLSSMYAYKADIHDYFNSIPVGLLLPKLQEALSDDPRLSVFLSELLLEPRVLEKGQEIRIQKGIMAGTPQSSFYANLFLADLDRSFEARGILYARYSDDIIVFGETEEEIRGYASEIRSFFSASGLAVNPDKEFQYLPHQAFTFLGFQISGKTVDIAPATVKKLKAKMRRKRDALSRWQKRSASDPERAASAFIRVFNRKLLESPEGHELSWANWFFSVINTTESLHEIDRYAQDCIRYLLSGSHTKKRFRVSYEDLKALGYRSLVHEYYNVSVKS